MNKITLLSASALVCVVCTTCSTPSTTVIREAQAFADMKTSNSSGIKCAASTNHLVEEPINDSIVADTHSGIICIED